MSEASVLNLEQAAEALEACLDANLSTCLWGPPGIGKSAIVKETGARMGMKVLDIRLVLLDPVDLRGLPHINGDGRAHWAQPSFWPTEEEEQDVIIFLDELNRAPTLTQNAAFQIVLDRKCGEYSLRPGDRVVAACNRESDGGGVTKMPDALANRFNHFNIEADLNAWCKWASTEEANVHPMVIGFLRFRPECFFKHDRNAKAFPTPRSWEAVSKLTHQLDKKRNNNLSLAMYASAVGHGAAVEYAAFEKLYRNLPDIDAILMDPKGAPVPSKPAELYAVSAALGRFATENNLGRVIEYTNRLQVEYAVMAMKDAVTRNKALTKVGEFTKWAVQNSHIVM